MSAVDRLLARAWYVAGAEGIHWMARPLGDPHASASGPDPVQVLLVGGGPAVSWGVASHELGFAGALAREVSALTGRGADVLVASDHSLDVCAAPGAVLKLDLSTFDCLLLTLGVEDVIRGLRPAQWEQGLSALLDLLRILNAGLPVVVAGVQQLRSIPVYDHPLADRLESDARKLDQVTEALCLRRPDASFAAMRPDASCAPGPRRTPKNYPYWASILARPVADTLRAERSSVR